MVLRRKWSDGQRGDTEKKLQDTEVWWVCHPSLSPSLPPCWPLQMAKDMRDSFFKDFRQLEEEVKREQQLTVNR